jgi:hypothetical protein
VLSVRRCFDTFFDAWGDFNNKRAQDAQLNSTLGVFVHRAGKTQQVCEYLWENNPNARIHLR